jgi:hypothetical protein
MQIYVENILVFAMLNFMRDKCICEDDEHPLIWDEVRNDYIEEAADAIDHYVLTQEETEELMKRFLNGR